jgi:hypothetical protein
VVDSSSLSPVRALGRLRHLSPSRRRLLYEAAPALWLIRLLLRRVAFRRLERWLTTFHHCLPRHSAGVAPQEVAWAVQAAGPQDAPAQALAAQWLLNRRGLETRLHLAPEGRVWLECGDAVLVGGASPLPTSGYVTLHRG